MPIFERLDKSNRLRYSVISDALGITMGDIVKGVLPHVGLIIIGLVIFTIFPQIITWLPSQMIR